MEVRQKYFFQKLKIHDCLLSFSTSLFWNGSNVRMQSVSSFRVKSGKFRHTFANSGNPDETAPYEPSHQDFHCLLIYLFFIPRIEV